MKQIRYSLNLSMLTLLVIAGTVWGMTYSSGFARNCSSVAAPLSSLQSQQFRNPEISVFASSLNRPFGLVFDSSGNLLCTIQGNHGQGGIIKILPSGRKELLVEPAPDEKEVIKARKIQEKYAFVTPGGIDIVDDSIITYSYWIGTVYLGSMRSMNRTWLIINPAGGTINTESVYVDGKLREAPEISYSYAMAVDRENKVIYLANIEGNGTLDSSLVIWKRDLRNKIYDTYLTQYIGGLFDTVTSMALSDGALFVARTYKKGITKITADKTISEFVTADAFERKQILGIIFDSDGNLYATTNREGSNGQIYKISPDGKSSSIFAEGFTRPAGLAIRGNYLYVADFGDGKIYKVRIARQSAGSANQQKANDLSKPSTKSLTNQDVIALAKDGSDEASLIQTIKEAKVVQFDLSPKAQSELLRNGISNRVIATMRARQAATQKPSPSRRAQRTPDIGRVKGAH